MDKQLNCIIVDDEEIARDVIENYVSRVSYLNLVEKCSNALDAHKVILSKQIDLIFLDIEMPGISGVELLNSLHNIPHVIITSANKDYAVEAFNLNVDDFILKPVTFARFLKAIGKIQVEVDNTKFDEYFYVNENKRMIKIDVEKILYLESLRDYVKIIMQDKSVTTHQQLSFFEKKLPESKFIRIHRSIIVSIDKIQAFTSTLIDIGITELPIGRNYKESIQKRLVK